MNWKRIVRILSIPGVLLIQLTWIFHLSAPMVAQQKLELIHALETSIGGKTALGLGAFR